MHSQLASLHIPGWDPRERRATFLSSGESYDAWKLEDTTGTLPPLVVRISHRGSDLAKDPRAEFEALTSLEGTGVAPRAWDYDGAADNPFGAPYLVTGFVKGEVKEPQEWTEKNLLDVAALAARLHRHGMRDGGSSAVGWWNGSITYWRETSPEALDNPRVAHLLSSAEEFILQREPVFQRLRHITRVHGDLAATNVLFDDGNPHLVDWEWSELDDPARDLALIGGEVAGGPWYVPMKPALIRRFVTHYCSEMGLERADAVEMETRRETWMVMDRLFNAVHLLSRDDPHRAEWADTILAALHSHLSR